ncbi:MAG TPA: DNA repair protein RecO [Anaerolineales bacterium]|nr:DNA repair protein RecO [Anaerolineales bacterium]
MSTPRTTRTHAIVLRQFETGEADSILTLLTPQQGKIRVLAKGIRKLRSRKAGHLDLFMLSDVLLAHGRNMDIITQADTVQAFRGLRENLRRASYAAYVVELLDKFTVEEEASPVLFKLLSDTLTHINSHENLPLIARYYEVQLLSLVGFQPELQWCVISGEEICPEDQFFDPLLGGIVRPPYRDQARIPQPISLPALKLLRFLQRSSFENALALQVASETLKEVENHLLRYLSLLLERNLKSVSFLRSIERTL